MLEVEDVRVVFGGVKAVDGVTIHLDARSLGIVGANGAGKTTLLDAISGLAPIRSGSIHFDGEPLTHVKAWRRVDQGVGRSFQHPVLMEAMTMEENLRVGRGVRQEDVLEMAAAFKLERWMSRPIVDLPYGIRKIADLARAALSGRKLLLCDEPFSGLDEAGRDEMASVLAAFGTDGRTLVIIEHDIGRVRSLVERFVVLDLGRKIFDGEPGAAMIDPAVRSALMGLAG